MTTKTQIARVKLKDLKDNPFRKSDDLDDEQVDRLASSIKGIGLLGAFEVQQNPKTKKYHLVYGHHRREAAIKVFGKEFTAECIVREWDEDKMMRGKSNENLTATKDPKRLIREIGDIRDYLKKMHPDSGRIAKTHPFEPGSLDDVCDWLNKFGIIMGRSTISDLLNINDNLAADLKKRLDKGSANTQEDDNHINLSNAAMLAKLDTPTEQKEIWKALKESSGPRMHRVRTRAKIISKYKQLKKKAEVEDDKNAAKEIKAIREGKKDIAAIGIGVGYNEENIPAITPTELFIKVEEALYKAGVEMEIASKYIDKADHKILEKDIIYIRSFIKESLEPFTKKIFTKLKGGLFFTITEKNE